MEPSQSLEITDAGLELRLCGRGTAVHVVGRRWWGIDRWTGRRGVVVVRLVGLPVNRRIAATPSRGSAGDKDREG